MKITTDLKKAFGSWWPHFLNFITTEKFDRIFATLKQKSQAGAKIAPLSGNLFRAFAECPLSEIKCIICGICPYHTWDEKMKVPVADGLCMSSSITGRLQPSIENWYSAIEDEYNGGVLNPDMIMNPDLKFLANQGVLLYNVALTVEKDKPLSMNDMWMEFDKYFWTQVVNKYLRGIPIIFLGEKAHKSANYLTPMLHYPFLLSHPASAAYNGTKWDSKGTFVKVNNILQQNNGCHIEWYQSRHMQKQREQIEIKKKEEEKESIDTLPF